MIWRRVMVALPPVYSRQLPFCSSSRPGESGSAAQKLGFIVFVPYATISAISDATVLSDSHLSDQLRHRPPASACFSTPTTCSTEKRFLFTANLPFSGGRYCRELTLVCIRNRGAAHGSEVVESRHLGHGHCRRV